MNLQVIQSKLNAIYEKIPTVYPSFLNDREYISGPFLVSVTQEYIDSKKKIIVVGQETFGWLNYKVFCSSDKKIQIYLEEYGNFDFGIFKNQSKKYNSPFMNEFRKIVKRCSGDIHRSVLWLNINMFDYNKCSIFLAQKEIQAFIFQVQKRLFVDQLKILEPNVIIFFAGINTNYEKMIKDYYYPNTIFKEVDIFKEDRNINKPGIYLYLLKHYQLPSLTFLTCHPNRLYRSGKHIKDRVIDYIVEKINETK